MVYFIAVFLLVFNLAFYFKGWKKYWPYKRPLKMEGDDPNLQLSLVTNGILYVCLSPLILVMADVNIHHTFQEIVFRFNLFMLICISYSSGALLINAHKINFEDRGKAIWGLYICFIIGSGMFLLSLSEITELPIYKILTITILILLFAGMAKGPLTR